MPNPSEWDSSHAANLRAFLDTPSGKLMLEVLDALRPALLEGAHMYRTLVRNGEVRGYEMCRDCIELIVSPDFLNRQQPAEESYPSLDDESKWKD